MSRRFSKVSSIILLVLFAFFFASTNLFFHTHEGLSGKIVHSHPWSAKSHNHTCAQFQAISILSANIFDLSASMELSDSPQRTLIASAYPDYCVVATGGHPVTISLRGPPMFV
ncbi:MAG: hypothetical protein MJY55_06355 [Bacteroidales bacterium]|nr:hypothetical protein [Bacteroidales bacterium]